MSKDKILDKFNNEEPVAGGDEPVETTTAPEIKADIVATPDEEIKVSKVFLRKFDFSH